MTDDQARHIANALKSLSSNVSTYGFLIFIAVMFNSCPGTGK